MDTETTAEMPLACVETDWSEVERRYLEGEELGSIAADCGTTAKAISQRAWRHHWKAQQFKALERDKAEVEREVKGCLTVSVLREARLIQREDVPQDFVGRDLWGRCRTRLLETAAKLFGWSDDPLASAKRVKPIDV